MPIIFIGIIIIYIIAGIVKEIYLRKNKKEKTNKISFAKISIFLLISVFPIIWYIVVRNHSEIHIFFTYRNLSIFMLNVQIALGLYLNLIEDMESQKEINNI